jgi:hypothetical protein
MLLVSFDTEIGDPVSLSRDGSIVAVGHYTYGRGRDGKLQVFCFRAEDVYRTNNGEWILDGAAIEGKFSDQLGWSVSLSSDGSIVAAGAPQWDRRYKPTNIGFVSATDVASTYRFVDGQWVLLAEVLEAESGTGDVFGFAVVLSSAGNVLAVGDPRKYRYGFESGIIQVYQCF